MHQARIVLCFLLLLAGGFVPAAEDAVPTAAGNAGCLVGMGFSGAQGAIGIGATLVSADAKLWPQSELDAVLPIRAQWLTAVRDRTALGWLDKKRADRDRLVPIPGIVDNLEEGLAYCDGLDKAARTRPDLLAAEARRDLSIRDVFSESNALRGEIVHIAGTLRLVHAQTVPEMLRGLGIEKLYEGWVIDRDNPRRTWCIVFTELPEELKHIKSDELHAEIEFDGYFLKILTYEAQGTKSDPNRIEEAPLVLGRRPVVRPIPAMAGGDPWSELIVPGLAALVIVILGSLGLFTWSYRRGDRSIHRKIEAQKMVVIPDTIPDPPEPKKADVAQGKLPEDWMR
jgi:hypothetical protein